MNWGVQSLICIKDVIIIFKTSFHYTAAVITLNFKENVDSLFASGVYSPRILEFMRIILLVHNL